MPSQNPDALELRELKFSPKTSRAARSAAAEKILSAGRTTEAFDLYLIADDEKGIARMREMAVQDGLPHLLLAMRRYGLEATTEEWNRAGDKAFDAGRYREAYRAYREAGNEEGLAKVAEVLPDYEPFKPQGK